MPARLRPRIHRRTAASAGGNGQEPSPAVSTEALGAACEAGNLLRMQVSGLLSAIGWALSVVGITPLIIDQWERAVSGK